MIRPRDGRPPSFIRSQYAVGQIDPNATEEDARWILEGVVHELMKHVPDPRLGEITIVYYDGTPAQIRALWKPANQ
jgi:hypothetical protein